MTTKELSEEEKMRRVPGILFVDGATGRRARVQGTGLEVFEIIHGYEVVGEVIESMVPPEIQAQYESKRRRPR